MVKKICETPKLEKAVHSQSNNLERLTFSQKSPTILRELHQDLDLPELCHTFHTEKTEPTLETITRFFFVYSTFCLKLVSLRRPILSQLSQ